MTGAATAATGRVLGEAGALNGVGRAIVQGVADITGNAGDLVAEGVDAVTELLDSEKALE